MLRGVGEFGVGDVALARREFGAARPIIALGPRLRRARGVAIGPEHPRGIGGTADVLERDLTGEPRERRIIVAHPQRGFARSEEHTSELQSLMRISYAVFCLKKKKENNITLVRHNPPPL